MKKTGKFSLRLIFLIAALASLVSFPGKAQTPNLDVSATVSETSVYTGERINLTIKVSGSFSNVSRPELPEFKGLRLLSNNPSTSRQFSIVNGKASTSYAYSYYLIAEEKGEVKIPEVTINIDGENYRTDPISINILDRNAAAQKSTSGNRPDIYVQLESSDTQPVTGQQLIIDVNLFFKDGLEVNSYQPVPGWKAEGFWKEELENSERPQAQTVIIDGIRFRKARLLQFALFPTKTGDLTISPYEIIVSVRSSSSNDRLSSFFGGFGSNQREMKLRSDPIAINVEPLPSLDQGENTGAVGSFNINRSIQNREVVVGESIEIETNISGTGNIPLISKPEYELPEGFEIYEPRETSSLNRRNQRISGTKTYTDVFIARNPGTYTIPQATLAYFNPGLNRYVKETLPPLSVTAKRDPDATISSNQNLSLDIKPVTGLTTWTNTTGSPALTTHWWFWLGLIIPLLVITGGYWRKTYLERMQTDSAFARAKKSDETAHQRLQQAIHLSENGNIKEAYHALEKALTGFIGDRLNLPKAGLSIRDYAKALEERKVDPNLIKNIRMLLDKCATISYAPDTSHAYLKSHVGLAQSILEKLRKEL